MGPLKPRDAPRPEFGGVLLHLLSGADALEPVAGISKASHPGPQTHTCPDTFWRRRKVFQLLFGAKTRFSRPSLSVLSDIRAAASLTNSSPGEMSAASLFHSLRSLSRVSRVGFERS